MIQADDRAYEKPAAKHYIRFMVYLSICELQRFTPLYTLCSLFTGCAAACLFRVPAQNVQQAECCMQNIRYSCIGIFFFHQLFKFRECIDLDNHVADACRRRKSREIFCGMGAHLADTDLLSLAVA